MTNNASLHLYFAKGINASWKTGMLRRWMQKHLHILSKTTAIENSNELIQSMSQKSFTQTQKFWNQPLFTLESCVQTFVSSVLVKDNIQGRQTDLCNLCSYFEFSWKA